MKRAAMYLIYTAIFVAVTLLGATSSPNLFSNRLLLANFASGTYGTYLRQRDAWINGYYPPPPQQPTGTISVGISTAQVRSIIL